MQAVRGRLVLMAQQKQTLDLAKLSLIVGIVATLLTGAYFCLHYVVTAEISPVNSKVSNIDTNLESLNQNFSAFSNQINSQVNSLDRRVTALEAILGLRTISANSRPQDINDVLRAALRQKITASPRKVALLGEKLLNDSARDKEAAEAARTCLD
jgi:hypothetical protein